MPCMTSDGMSSGPSYDDHKRLEERIARLEREHVDVSRFLCAICSALGDEALRKVLGQVDWRRAGIGPAEFWAWWLAHKQDDGPT